MGCLSRCPPRCPLPVCQRSRPRESGTLRPGEASALKTVPRRHTPPPIPQMSHARCRPTTPRMCPVQCCTIGRTTSAHCACLQAPIPRLMPSRCTCSVKKSCGNTGAANNTPEGRYRKWLLRLEWNVTNRNTVRTHGAKRRIDCVCACSVPGQVASLKRKRVWRYCRAEKDECRVGQ